MIQVLHINEGTVVDGEGVRTSVYVAGCRHFCKGCHNPESWRFDGGTPWEAEALVERLLQSPIRRVTFTGGDPIFQVGELLPVARRLRSEGFDLWCYTGFRHEELLAMRDPDIDEWLSLLDVLVDGRFELAQRDLTLAYRGSRNQRVLRLREV